MLWPKKQTIETPQAVEKQSIGSKIRQIYANSTRFVRGIPTGDFSQWTNASALASSGVYFDNTDINKLINSFLRSYRMTSRNLQMTNGIFNKYLLECENNVVGSRGIYVRPAINAYGEDQEANIALSQEIERRFYKWASDASTFSVRGDMDLVKMQQIMERCRAVDGEAFMIVRKRNGTMKCEVLDAARVPINQRPNQVFPNGDYYSNGIRFDSDGKPKTLYVMRYDPVTFTFDPTNFEEIPFELVFHYKRDQHANQQRGIPDITSGSELLSKLQQFVDASLTTKLVGASTMGFITKTNAPESYVSMDSDEKVYNYEFGAGNIIELEEGKDIKTFSPNGSADGIKEYTDVLYGQVAMQLGITVQGLKGDTSNASFSASKLAENIQSAAYAVRTEIMINNVLKPLYEMWLRNELLTGGLEIDPILWNKVLDCEFIKQKQQSIDPKAEASVVINLVKAGLMSKQSAIASRGDDPVITFQQLADEQELFKEINKDEESNPNKGNDSKEDK